MPDASILCISCSAPGATLHLTRGDDARHAGYDGESFCSPACLAEHCVLVGVPLAASDQAIAVGDDA